MSISAQIVTLFQLVQHKIADLNARLALLETQEQAKTHLDVIQPLLDKLGCHTPTYCLPDLCSGEQLPTFPFPPIDDLPPRGFPEIPDIPLPPKAPPPVFPPEDEDEVIAIMGAVVIEGMYVESQDLSRLPAAYQNIAVGSGHVCNNAKFAVYANDVHIGDINLNNDSLGQTPPYDNQQNTPSVLTGGTWSGSSNARYSRIDITAQQAAQIIGNTSSTVIQLKLTALSSSPHTNITWLRVSRKVNNQLQIVQDVLADLNQLYSVDVAG